MCKNQKFFICKNCGNLAGLIENKGIPMVCCGEKMTELVPNTVEASAEKHLPVAAQSACSCGCGCIYLNVQIGSVPHPMEEAHNISFVYAETERGGQRKCLKPGDEPKVTFGFSNDKPIAVYAYCNLHGLWKTEIK